MGVDWPFTKLGLRFFEGTLPALVDNIGALVREVRRFNASSAQEAGGEYVFVGYEAQSGELRRFPGDREAIGAFESWGRENSSAQATLLKKVEGSLTPIASFGDGEFFAPEWEVEEAYRKAAYKKYHEDGACEIEEEETLVSLGNGGAYVQAWVWVSEAEILPEEESDADKTVD